MKNSSAKTKSKHSYAPNTHKKSENRKSKDSSHNIPTQGTSVYKRIPKYPASSPITTTKGNESLTELRLLNSFSKKNTDFITPSDPEFNHVLKTSYSGFVAEDPSKFNQVYLNVLNFLVHKKIGLCKRNFMTDSAAHFTH